MSRFIESIRFEMGIFHNLELHQERMDRTLAHFHQNTSPINLKNFTGSIQTPKKKGRYKLRIIYGPEIEQFEFLPYQPTIPRGLQVVETGDFDYSFKFLDRKNLNRIKEEVGKEHDAIICTKGMIRDTTYSNIALFIDGKWLSPSQPLLKGVKREELIRNNIIKPANLQVGDLARAHKIRLINAMLDWGEVEVVM